MIDYRVTLDETIQAYARDTPEFARFYESNAFPGSLSIFVRNTAGLAGGLRLNFDQVVTLRDTLDSFIEKHAFL